MGEAEENVSTALLQLRQLTNVGQGRVLSGSEIGVNREVRDAGIGGIRTVRTIGRGPVPRLLPGADGSQSGDGHCVSLGGDAVLCGDNCGDGIGANIERNAPAATARRDGRAVDRDGRIGLRGGWSDANACRRI